MNEKKFFVMKWRKQEAGENTVSLILFKKKEKAKTEIVQKNVVFGMTGRYVKGENKGQKKDSQIKENLQKGDTFQKGQLWRQAPAVELSHVHDQEVPWTKCEGIEVGGMSQNASVIGSENVEEESDEEDQEVRDQC